MFPYASKTHLILLGGLGWETRRENCGKQTLEYLVCSALPSLNMTINPFIQDLPLEPAAASTPLDSLRSFLSSLPTPTAVATMLTSITRLILLYAAKSRACSQVLLGNSMTSISISLISSISSGGGFSVVEEREEVWHGIRVIRPLRDVTSKECAAWLHWARLDVVGGGIVHRSDQGIGQLTRGRVDRFKIKVACSIISKISLLG